MESNRAIPILNKAQRENYGIPSMCCYNTEGILATVRAATAKHSPAMILLFPWAIHYAELTAYCHERGIACEAEPGRIEGGEDGVGDTQDLEGLLTTPDEAQRFVDCGIDWLAPAFGNVHGNYGPRGNSARV